MQINIHTHKKIQSKSKNKLNRGEKMDSLKKKGKKRKGKKGKKKKKKTQTE